MVTFQDLKWSLIVVRLGGDDKKYHIGYLSKNQARAKGKGAHLTFRL